MSYKEYLKDLKLGNLKPVYLFYGTEKYLIEYLLKETKKKYIDELYESLNYINIDGEKLRFSSIENANETLPFMSEKKLVVINDWESLVKKQRESSESDEEKFVEYLESPNPQSILIFILNGDKIDKRRKIIKSFSKYGRIIEVNRLSDTEITNWISKQIKSKEKKINNSDINKIIEYTGYFDKESDSDLFGIENEIIKIVDFVGDRENITTDDIEKIVTKSVQSSIFELVDLIAQRNMRDSINNLRNLVESGVAIQMIVYMINRQLRLIFSAKVYLDKGYSQRLIKEKMGIRYDFIVGKLILQSKNFTIDEIKLAIIKSSDLDLNIKLGKIDEEIGLEKLVVEIIEGKK